MMRSREPLSRNPLGPRCCSGPVPPGALHLQKRLGGGRDELEAFYSPPIRRLNSQLQEEEVLLFGLEDVNQLEDVGMLHPEEGRRQGETDVIR